MPSRLRTHGGERAGGRLQQRRRESLDQEHRGVSANCERELVRPASDLNETSIREQVHIVQAISPEGGKALCIRAQHVPCEMPETGLLNSSHSTLIGVSRSQRISAV